MCYVFFIFCLFLIKTGKEDEKDDGLPLILKRTHE